MTTITANTEYTFPPHYSFPPFFTLQPNPITRSSQLRSWSTLIQSYCRSHRLFSLTLIDALNTPLFNNTSLKRKLALQDARDIIEYMCSKEGGERAEWIGARAGKTRSSEKCWVYWRRPEEWAGVLEAWVEGTGQKGSVLTFYELIEGDVTEKQGISLLAEKS